MRGPILRGQSKPLTGAIVFPDWRSRFTMRPQAPISNYLPISNAATSSVHGLCHRSRCSTVIGVAGVGSSHYIASHRQRRGHEGRLSVGRDRSRSQGRSVVAERDQLAFRQTAVAGQHCRERHRLAIRRGIFGGRECHGESSLIHGFDDWRGCAYRTLRVAIVGPGHRVGANIQFRGGQSCPSSSEGCRAEQSACVIECDPAGRSSRCS